MLLKIYSILFLHIIHTSATSCSGFENYTSVTTELLNQGIYIVFAYSCLPSLHSAYAVIHFID